MSLSLRPQSKQGLSSTKVLDSIKLDSGGSKGGRRMGREEERNEMGRVGTKSGEDSIKMGSLSSM